MKTEVPKELLEEAEKVYVTGLLQTAWVRGVTSPYAQKKADEQSILFAEWLNINFYPVFIEDVAKIIHYCVSTTSVQFKEEYNKENHYNISELLTKFKEENVVTTLQN